MSWMRNVLVGLVAVAIAIGIYVGKTQAPVSLAALAERSLPLEVALSNGKPTILEFYAEWCSACQAMAPIIAELEASFNGEVNLVMLNVDNTKWLPELAQYRVNGIPHFEFLNRDGRSIATAIGSQPPLVMAQYVTALKTDAEFPVVDASQGQTSPMRSPRSDATQPRSHS